MYDFNLAFGHPSKDVCSTCVKYRLKLKDPECTGDKKCRESALFLLHRRKGRKFYDLLSAVEETFTIAFDVMQNLVLPKSPISQSYYSRQLYQYVFGVVRHRGHGQNQRKEDIHLFTWLENQNKKDSNMVTSALQYYLGTVVQCELREYNTLRLFSDSCYGQNKCVINAFCPEEEEIQRLENKLRLSNPWPQFLATRPCIWSLEAGGHEEELHIATISVPGNHEQTWKRLCTGNTGNAMTSKLQQLNTISDASVLEICGDKLGFKQLYSGDFCYHSVLKHEKKWDTFKPAVVPRTNCVKEAKKADVLKLLGELGVSQTVRNFYEDALAGVGCDHVGRQDLEESSDEE
ncbi:hypothetical protein N1851_028406 [Merluccius polli]|uniref:Uncharacterized protein n=1 Tax=Merluccius polli TaxID=89951 RepID=A0AA47M8V8_MERPO|nr:hypothetical protein N1851_028406 [Merluccius polli]